MTKTEFEKYIKVKNKIIDIFIEEDLPAIQGVEILYHMLRNYPYCVDQEGHYIYNYQLYDSVNALPLDGLLTLKSMLSK